MICFVVATQREASPLIKYYRLKKKQEMIYQNDSYILAISGMGRIRSAAISGYAKGLYPSLQSMINVGVAAHKSLPVKELVFVSGSGSIYPFFPFPMKERLSKLITVDQTERTFKEDALYDMEGSGFFQAARLFCSVEFVHSIKIVSDNQSTPPPKDLASFTEMIEENIEPIDSFVQKIHLLIQELDTVCYDEYKQTISTSSFSATQKEQFKKLYLRYKALHNTALPQKKESETMYLKRLKTYV